MSTIEVKISQQNAELTAIVKNGENDSLPAFISNLQKAKEETNEFLTGLVEQEKQCVLPKPKEATKRKPSETLAGIYLSWIYRRLTMEINIDNFQMIMAQRRARFAVIMKIMQMTTMAVMMMKTKLFNF